MFPTGVRAAKAQLRDLLAEEKRLAAEEAEKAARAQALLARVPKAEPMFLIRVNGDVVRCTSHDLRIWGLSWGTTKPEEIKELEAAVRDGSQKVEVGGGSSALSRLVKRLRWPYPQEARRLASLDRRITALQKEREELISTMGDIGYLRDLSEVAALIIRHGRAARAASKADHDSKGWATRRSGDAAREAATLTVHVQHLETKSKDPCPCTRCEFDRKMATQERELAARQKAEAKARKAHARHARFRGGCRYCEELAHEEDGTRYTGHGMVIVVSSHPKPRKGCTRCDRYLEDGYAWAKDCKVPEPPSPEEVAQLDAEAAAEADDWYGPQAGEVEADEVEEGAA